MRKKMDEYLQYMKTLRSQMNDVEDEAAKISVQEQMQLTNIRTLENDIHLGKSGIMQLKEDTEKMKVAKGEICSKILEKQKRIASLESDTAKLSQTLELIQQERVGLSSKLSEKRAYYNKVADDMNAMLQKQQEWVSTEKSSSELKEHDLVMEKVVGQRSNAEGKDGADGNLGMDNTGSDARKNLITELDSAKARLDEILTLKAKLLTENNKIKLAIEDVKRRENDFKEIRHVVKCACGEEYTVAVNM